MLEIYRRMPTARKSRARRRRQSRRSTARDGRAPQTPPERIDDPTSKTTPRPHAGGANRVSGLWCARAEGMSRELPEALAVALRVTDAPDKLWLRYHVGGSYASSIHGVPRQTQDIDLVVELSDVAVGPLTADLSSDFYVDEDAARAAVRSKGSFNLIHYESGIKVDFFVRGMSRSITKSSSATHRRLSTRHPNGACSSSRPKTCCCESSNGMRGCTTRSGSFTDFASSCAPSRTARHCASDRLSSRARNVP